MLPQEAAPRNVHGDAPIGEAGGSPASDRRTGTGTGRPDRSEAYGAKRRGQRAESARPDGMAHVSEQLHASGENGTAEDRLPVKEEDAGAEEENKKGQMTAAFYPLFLCPRKNIQHIEQLTGAYGRDGTHLFRHKGHEV